MAIRGLLFMVVIAIPWQAISSGISIVQGMVSQIRAAEGFSEDSLEARPGFAPGSAKGAPTKVHYLSWYVLSP